MRKKQKTLSLKKQKASACSNQTPKADAMPIAVEPNVSITSTAESKEKVVALSAAETPIHIEPIQQASAPEYTQAGKRWQALAEAVVGLAHRDQKNPLPCQDSAYAKAQRPMVIIADGAGSSAVSDIGAKAVTTGISRLLNTLEKQVVALLDFPASDNTHSARDFGLMLAKHALGILEDLALQHRRPLKDFRCTLLLAIRGKENILWLKIGDGALVAEKIQQSAQEKKPELFTFGEVGKGDFANLTTFIDEHLHPNDVQIGLHESQYITGLAAMSDGAADRLVAYDGTKVAGRIAIWLAELREEKLKRRTLTKAFYMDDFTQGTTGDDCCIALIAGELK